MTNSRLAMNRQMQMARDWVLWAGSVLFYGSPGAPLAPALDEVAAAFVTRTRVLRAPAPHHDRRTGPLRALSGLLSTVTSAEMATLSPAHRHAIVDGPTSASDPSVVAVGQAVLDLLHTLTRRTTMLVVIDNVHEMDPDTVEVLAFVAARLGTLPIQLAVGEEVTATSTPWGHRLCPPPLLIVRIETRCASDMSPDALAPPEPLAPP